MPSLPYTLLQRKQVNLSLAPFVNAATLAGYPTTTIGLTNFFTSGGLTVFADGAYARMREMLVSLLISPSTSFSHLFFFSQRSGDGRDPRRKRQQLLLDGRAHGRLRIGYDHSRPSQ